MSRILLGKCGCCGDSGGGGHTGGGYGAWAPINSFEPIVDTYTLYYPVRTPAGAWKNSATIALGDLVKRIEIDNTDPMPPYEWWPRRHSWATLYRCIATPPTGADPAEDTAHWAEDSVLGSVSPTPPGWSNPTRLYSTWSNGRDPVGNGVYSPTYQYRPGDIVSGYANEVASTGIPVTTFPTWSGVNVNRKTYARGSVYYTIRSESTQWASYYSSGFPAEAKPSPDSGTISRAFGVDGGYRNGIWLPYREEVLRWDSLPSFSDSNWTWWFQTFLYPGGFYYTPGTITLIDIEMTASRAEFIFWVSWSHGPPYIYYSVMEVRQVVCLAN